jgi:hypothetical protein
MSTTEVRSDDASGIGGVGTVPEWPDWYTDYLVREAAGEELPT